MTPDERLARWLAEPEGEPAPEGGEDLRRQLADEAVWAEPDSDLLDSIMRDIRHERLSRPDSPTAQPRASKRRLAAAAGGLVAAAAVAAIIVFPLRSEPADLVLQLESTELAQAASATVSVFDTPAGVAFILDLQELPPAPPGHFYEGWVRGPNGRVSIGSFHMRGGDGSVELWSGVPLEDYPMISVTLEPEDGDENSSGEVVLRGELPQE